MYIYNLCNDYFSKPGIISGFELTYSDSENMIHFSFFTMQVFSPRLKIVISKYNTRSILKSKGMRAIFQKKTKKRAKTFLKRAKKGKIFEN